MNIGDNIAVDFENDGKTLVLRVDLTKPGIPSASGKSLVIASSRGNQTAGDEIMGFGPVQIGLNVFKYPPRAGRGR